MNFGNCEFRLCKTQIEIYVGGKKNYISDEEKWSSWCPNTANFTVILVVSKSCIFFIQQQKQPILCVFTIFSVIQNKSAYC